MSSDPFESRLNQALTELIHTRPIEGEAVRATAIRTLIDLHLEAVRQGAAPPAHFAALMAGLLPRVSAETRAEAARRLARCPALPAELATLFAADEYTIAAPVLCQSPALPEAALLAATSGPCPRKACAVAARGGLSPAVVEALIAAGDANVATALAISQDHLDGTEASRIALSAHLPADAAARLASICGVTNEALSALFWMVAGPQRRKIVGRLSKRCLALAPDEAPKAPGGQAKLGARLLRLAAERRSQEIAIALSQELPIPEPLSRRIVDDSGGEALVVAARAAGIPVDHTTGIVLLTAPAARNDLTSLRALAALAETAEPSLARYLTGLWAQAGSAAEASAKEPDAPHRTAIRHEAAIAPPATRRRTEASGSLRELGRLAEEAAKARRGS